MSDILNYQFLDPMASFTKASQFGLTVAQQQAAIFEARQRAQAAADQLALNKAKAEAEAARQARIDALMGKINQPGATYQDYLQLSMLLPKDQAEAMREASKLLREDEQAAALSESSQIFSAFKAGRPDIAAQLIRKQATAEREAGNEDGARIAEEWAKMAEQDGDSARAVETLFGYQIAQMPGGDKAIESAIKLSAEARAAEEFPVLLAQKQVELDKAKTQAEKDAIDLKYRDKLKQLEVQKAGADIGLTNAQILETLANAKKLAADTQKLMLEVKAAKDRGDGMTPAQVFQMEKQLRDEYVKRSAQFTELRTSYSTIKASGEAAYADTTGAADVAMITAFMKMLDPGSVVRETEFANAENTAGLFNTLKNLLPKIGQGKKLGDAQRKNFLGLAAKYMEAAVGFEKELRTDLTKVATDYGLSTDRVFGASRAQAGFGAVEPVRLGEGIAPQPVEEVDL